MKIISVSTHIANWDYVDKHTSKLQNRDIVNYRIKVLEFWNKHGLDAALQYANDTHPKNNCPNTKNKCSRATLYRWRKNLLDSGKRDRMGRCRLSAIDSKSTRPIHCRLPRDYDELHEPIRIILEQHNTLGKYKVHYILVGMVKSGKLVLCHLETIPSISTIGRIIKSMRELNRLPSKQRLSLHGDTGKLHVISKKRKKKLRRGNYKPKKPGDLVQMDGIIMWCYGKRRYILNAVDYVSSKAISIILPNGKARTIAAVLDNIDKLFGFTVKNIQTDNGSEYMADFEDKMGKLGKTHFYNYVKKPQWNGKVERFNRTLQEEWLNDPDLQILLADDLEEANRKLQKYMGWYNNERPHQAINYMTPTEYVLYWTKGELKKSQMS